jgi:signal transduction histidine kinase
VRIFFTLIVILTLCHHAAQAQSISDVQWFNGIFRTVNRGDAEKEIDKKENERVISIENNDPKKEVKILMELGGRYLTAIKSREVAMEFFIKALEIEDSLNFHRERIFTLLAIARVFEEVEDYVSSGEYIAQAKNLNEAEVDHDILILILEEAGRIETKSGETTAAIESFQLILKYAQQIKSNKKQGDALFNLGRLYMLTGNYDRALKLHKQALALRRSTNDKVNEALSLNSFADLYVLMNNNERAMANQLATLEIRQELKDTLGIAFTYNRIAELHLKNKNYDSAIVNLQLALRAAIETQQLEEVRKSYDYLSISYKELKDFRAALQYRESFLAMDEFIRNENGVAQLTDTRNRYMLFQKEKEIGKLEEGRNQRDEIIQAQARLQTFLFVMVILAFIIVLLITYLYFVKRKLARSLKEVNDAKDKLFSIIGHDIKGPLNSLMSFSTLLSHHGDMVSKEEIKMLATDLDKSLKNLFALLENLLQWARTQTGNIDFKLEEVDITTLLNENKQLLQAQAATKNISLISNYRSPLVGKVNINSINTVIRNLLGNAIKFTPNNGKIILSAETKESLLLVSVADNGVGIDPVSIQKLFKLGTKHSTPGTAQEKGTGLGLILCKEFIEKNGGTIGVTSKQGEGSKFYFTIPLN